METVGNVYFLDAFYEPNIKTFDAVRYDNVKKEENDEGTTLLVTISLGKSAKARPEIMSMYLYYRNSLDTESD